MRQERRPDVRTFNVGRQAWENAKQQAECDGLPLARSLEIILFAYSRGDVTLTPGTPDPARERARRTAEIPQDVWKGAAARAQLALDPETGRSRPQDPETPLVASMSELCELLLTAYGRGGITITAHGHAAL